MDKQAKFLYSSVFEVISKLSLTVRQRYTNIHKHKAQMFTALLS